MAQNIQECFTSSKTHAYLYAKLGVTVGFRSSSSINGLDETLICESLPLNRVHSIKNGALKFCHVVREEEASHDLIHPIVNQCLIFSNGSSNRHCYNSLSDESLL